MTTWKTGAGENADYSADFESLYHENKWAFHSTRNESTVTEEHDIIACYM